LIFKDDSGIGQAIETQLIAANEKIVVVTKSKTFTQIDETHYGINSFEKEDYARLVSTLIANGNPPNRVIHLWNVEKTLSATNYSSCAEVEEAAFYSPLYLEQAFINNNAVNQLNLLFVTNGALAVGGESITSPLKTLAIGPARCINNEMKLIVSGELVDVSFTHSSPEQIAQQLIAEAQFRNGEWVVAYRKNERWAEFFEKAPHLPISNPQPMFKEQGVYLITGGTGGLGLEFAKHIANQVKATIILAYRTPLPPQAEWQQYIQSNPSDITTEKIKSILSIEEKGSTVHLFKAEAHNQAQMTALKKFTEQETGGLNGIIHAAGIAGGGIIAFKTKEMADDVLKAKTRGTLLMDELWGVDKLDFVVYFSSVSAVLGDASRVDYTGANSFMDTYACYRNQIKPGSAYSVNWDSWGKVGMAARWEETQALNRKKLYLNEKSYQQGIYLISKKDHEEIYQVGFDDAISWVYKEHIVAGQPAIVGTFIINLFTQYAKLKYADKTPVISDLFFLKPVFLNNKECPNIRIYAVPENGKMKVNLSVLDISKATDTWDVVATAYVSAEEPSAHQKIDFATEIANFGGEEKKEQMFQKVTVNGADILSYSERWLNITKKYKKGSAFLLEQTLKDEFVDDVKNFSVHPALFDTTVANLFLYYTRDGYLPFNYKKLTIYGNFTSRIYAKVDVINEPKQGNVAVFNESIYNENGELVLKAEGYSLVAALNEQKENEPAVASKAKPADEEFILPEEGLEIFDRIVYYGNDTNVIVTPYNLLNTIKKQREDKKEKEKEEETATTYDRPELSTEYVAPSNEIEETVAKIWGQVLGIGQIGINDNFNELGGNSLLVVQAVSNISNAFSVQIPVELFKGPITIKSLAEYIMGLLVQDIDDSELEALLNEIE
jgi:acyl carrier protein/NADP-dependent 3-hydroxy acid dehydrogenase YdfG